MGHEPVCSSVGRALNFPWSFFSDLTIKYKQVVTGELLLSNEHEQLNLCNDKHSPDFSPVEIKPRL